MKQLLAASVVMMVAGAQAATYDWNGNAGNGLWTDNKNWTVKDSTYTGPNEQKKNSCINDDCDQIVIDNGDTVNSGSYLSIDGSLEDSATPAMILDNGSKLIAKSIWIANGLGTKGQIGIRDGATLIVKEKLDVGNDGSGWVFVSDGNLIVKKYLGIGSGKYASGRMTVSGKSIVTVGKDMILSDSHSAKSQMTINDGRITVGGTVCLGGKYPAEEAPCQIFLKGGVLKGENLIFKKKLSKIIYTGGKLLINAKKLSEADMKKLTASGQIDVSGAKTWKITTIDGYTSLVPE